MSLRAGSRLGPYEVLSPLGAGGMGEVYRARDTRLDRLVAVKVLPDELSGDPERRHRLVREARAISRVSHACICALFDVGEQDGAFFLVMEHLDGETLAARLERGPLPVDQALRVAADVTDALEAAHRHGIVHRDLKPGNVMLTPQGTKVLDFGLARLWEPQGGLAPGSGATESLPLTGGGRPRHRALHGARADRGAAGGRAGRPFRAGRDPLRVDGWPQAVCCGQPGRADGGDPVGGAASGGCRPWAKFLARTFAGDVLMRCVCSRNSSALSSGRSR